MSHRFYAPGRVEVLGNHTDYNNGLVLSFAVGYGTTVTSIVRNDHRLRLFARDLDATWEGDVRDLQPSAEQPWANYVLGVFAQFQERGYQSPGLDIEISSNLPMGAGLSSSAALEMSTALLAQAVNGSNFTPLELARIGQLAEHTYVGVQCGLLDQLSSLCSREGCLTAIDFRSLQVRNLPMPSDARFIIANSHAQHALVTGEYNERRASCEGAAELLGAPSLREVTPQLLEQNAARLPSLILKRARHIVGENARVQAAEMALHGGSLESLGALLFESHRSSQENFENSCAELDLLVQAAHDSGACLGARLSGGGFGGATINLVRCGQEEVLEAALKRALPQVTCIRTSAAAGALQVE